MDREAEQQNNNDQQQERRQAVHPANLKEPLVDVYRGSKEVKGKYKPVKIHKFDTMDLWGTKYLDNDLEGKEGRKLRVEYTGKKKYQLQNGATIEPHTFSVKDGREKGES